MIMFILVEDHRIKVEIQAQKDAEELEAQKHVVKLTAKELRERAQLIEIDMMQHLFVPEIAESYGMVTGTGCIFYPAFLFSYFHISSP